MFQTPSLRNLLRANAAYASITGLAGLIATGSIAEWIGVSEHRIINSTAIGLLVFGLMLVITSGAPTNRLVPAGRLITAADALWVVGTIVVIAVAGLPAQGNVILAGVAVIVATFATLQARTNSTIDRRSDSQSVHFSKVLNGNVDAVWAAVIDHETYGQLAPNLSRVLPTGPDGPDLTRRCWDTRGRHWDEACTLWEDGHRFAVEVDTTAVDYPYPLEYLRGEWAVRGIDDDHTEVTVRFDFRPKPGPAGSAFAAAMATGAKPMLRRIMSGWQRMIPSIAASA
ncbi:MAG: SRPBCC family protein [Acidimicrobiales bacterium]